MCVYPDCEQTNARNLLSAVYLTQFEWCQSSFFSSCFANVCPIQKMISSLCYIALYADCKNLVKIFVHTLRAFTYICKAKRGLNRVTIYNTYSKLVEFFLCVYDELKIEYR